MVQIFSWRKESTEGTDPIANSSTAIYYFLKAQRSLGDFTYIQSQLFPHFKAYGQANDIIRIKSQAMTQIAGVPVNALPFYWIMGATSNADATGGYYTHDLTFADTYPSLTTRKESNGLYQHYVGNIAQTVNYRHNEEQFASAPLLQMGLLGRKPVTVGTGAGTPSNTMTPIYPGSSSTHYKKDTNFVFRYDTAGNNLDLSTRMMDFNISLSRILEADYDIQTSYVVPDQIKSSYQMVVIDFTVLRDSTTDQIMDDFNADIISSAQTFYDLNYQIYKNSTEYLKITPQNFKVATVTENIANYMNQEREVYRVTGMCVADSNESKYLTIQAKDQLNHADFFGAVV